MSHAALGDLCPPPRHPYGFPEQTWQNDLRACHPCSWSAQVPDIDTYPGWLDRCANISQDLESLCTVPD